MHHLKAFFSELSGGTGASQASSSYEGKVPIHELSHVPTKAWEKMKVKQTVKDVDPIDPATPISEDHIRFVCLSDTHSRVEKLEGFVPPGDVLLHTGDFTQIGLPKAVEEFDRFLGEQPHRAKIVIAGNHDLTFDMNLVENRRGHLQSQFGIQRSKFEDILEELKVKSSRELLKNCYYLEDSGVSVCGVNIFGSPWQPEFGDWGFNLPRGGPCLEKWDKIPDDTDILLTHGPPIGHGDWCFSGLRAGCVELLTTIQTRVKPKFHIFGHIHEAYGVTSDDQTTFINASNCTLRYKPLQLPIVFDYPVPDGHSKSELDNFPKNNLSQ
ncbi:metallophosphoesterase MPPED2 [Aplysia californica]|uniref:Metallophosphoesterase MPPED2 n=1 Tax=Aplysia californica TaxID=6500 RepID=A0ABM0K070_APLCA|nr:metallophosphoesterase MPPED2 [Aplysia californica]